MILVAGGLDRATLQEAVEVHKALRGRLAAPSAADALATAARERFPRSRYFEGPKLTPEAELTVLLEGAAQ